MDARPIFTLAERVPFKHIFNPTGKF